MLFLQEDDTSGSMSKGIDHLYRDAAKINDGLIRVGNIVPDPVFLMPDAEHGRTKHHAYTHTPVPGLNVPFMKIDVLKFISMIHMVNMGMGKGKGNGVVSKGLKQGKYSSFLYSGINKQSPFSS